MLNKNYSPEAKEGDPGFFSFLGNKIKDILAGDVVPSNQGARYNRSIS